MLLGFDTARQCVWMHYDDDFNVRDVAIGGVGVHPRGTLRGENKHRYGAGLAWANTEFIECVAIFWDSTSNMPR